MTISRIRGYPYELGIRQGVLLEVTFRDESIGYADCHPWPELGDDPLQFQLKKLDSGILTNLTRQSLIYSKIDAYSRANQTHLFNGLDIPDSHFLLMALDENTKKKLTNAVNEGFRSVKVKFGKNFPEEIRKLEEITNYYSIKFRFDCNNFLQKEEFDRLKDANIAWERVEYIEDPYPFDDSWYHLPFPIASDRQRFSAWGSFQTMILKPSARPWKHFSCNIPLVVTSYLGHPIGQVADAYASAILKQKNQVLDCGLLSHRVYKQNEFSERLTNIGPKFTVLEGYGFGFGDLLPKLNWKEIKALV